MPLFALSILMVTPNITAMNNMVDAARNSDPVPMDRGLHIPPKWFIPIALMLIPMYELFDKRSKEKFSPDEEYSWKEIKQSIKTITKNMVGDKKGKTESTKRALALLWKNIKNLYHLGFVGQRRKFPGFEYDKEERYLNYRKYRPPRGILGNADAILETLGRALFENLMFVAAGGLIYYIAINGLTLPDYNKVSARLLR